MAFMALLLFFLVPQTEITCKLLGHPHPLPFVGPAPISASGSLVPNRCGSWKVSHNLSFLVPWKGAPSCD